jgi:pyruvate dehydrogenase E1 component beta subunit
MKTRLLTYAESIAEGTRQLLESDKRVIVIGEGVPDPKHIFGTTAGLEAYPDRVLDMPVSENGMTGIIIGASLRGYRPILTHQRVDFSLLSMDQIVNTAAKWHFMFGEKQTVPIIIRTGDLRGENLQKLGGRHRGRAGGGWCVHDSSRGSVSYT